MDEKLVDKDWDILFVLDACRFDYFKEVVDEGNFDYFNNYERVWSSGSCTIEWFNEEFGNNTYPDITYVSANPYIRRTNLHKDHEIRAPENFPNLVSLIEKDGVWDGELGTILPIKVFEYLFRELPSSLDEFREQDRRYICHFLQPHTPFIAKGNRISMDDIRNAKRNMGLDVEGKVDVVSLKEFLQNGEYTVEEIRDAYRENVRYVLGEIESFCLSYLFSVELEDIDIVLTSDHGEGLFEDGFFNHPCNREIDYLREVPYVEVRN